MTAFLMESTRDTPDDRAGDDADHESSSRIGASLNSETWSIDSPTPPPEAGSSTSIPHVSLFSPSVPPPPSSAAPEHVPAASRTHVSHFRTPSHSRSLPSLSAVANMTKRSARLKVSDQHQPIVQLQTQIQAAQKSADDPTTPLENEGRRRTTVDLMGSERNTMTSLSKLFSETTTMSTSRAPSYNNATGPLYMRASNEAISLPDHLYKRGLLEGRHSDITILAFGQRYNLHRLILDRAPFFTSALSEPWIESQTKEVALHPEELDSNITQAAFELAIRKLYGVDISAQSDAEAVGLFATGCWLEMQDLIDSAIESILRQMAPDTLAYLIRLVTTNYYGRSGDRILESAKAMLSRNGWEMPIRYWDDMPGDIVRELVGSDGFFVHSEWDRWVLAKRLLDRRLRQAAVDAGLIQRGQKPIPQAPGSLRLMAVRFDGVYRQNAVTATHAASDIQGEWLSLYTTPDIERILVLLDEGIHYIHMDFEQLDFIRTARDVFGLPVMPDKVISNALWQQLALRQRVLNADDSSQELGLCQTSPEPDTTNLANKTGNDIAAKGKQRAVDSSIEESENASDSWDGNGKPRKFWVPSSDCNIVLGNGADPVVTTSSSFQRHATRLSATIQPEDAQWATDFASTPSTLTNPNTRIDQTMRPLSAGGSNAGQPKPIAYTEFPPFRFSAEFPNPRFLKEKKRVYSRTVSYAGSLWNIYIQKVRSAKNIQLGVYLHRAKDRDADEAAQLNLLSQQTNSSVDERIGQLEREMLLRSERRDLRRNARAIIDQAGEEDTSGSGGDADPALESTVPRLFPLGNLGRRRSQGLPRDPTHHPFRHFTASPTSDADGTVDSPVLQVTTFDASDNASDTSDLSDDENPTATYPNPSLASRDKRKSFSGIPTMPPYVDARPTIKTYFKIYSPSKGGRMLSIYESAPDRFNFSQSWGWKSSTLMLDEISLSGEDGEGMERKKSDGKLRFMVVIGNL